MNSDGKTEKERKRLKRPYFKLNLDRDFIAIINAFTKEIHSDLSPWKGISSHDRGRTGAVIRYLISHYVANSMLSDKKTPLFSKDDRDKATEYVIKLNLLRSKAKEED